MISDIIINSIIDSIVRSITYAITYAISTSIRNSIRNSITKQINQNVEHLLGSDGKIDEEKINSLIKVQVQPIGAGVYKVDIQEDVFNILNLNLITTKNTNNMFKIIKKEIVIKKLKAKIKKDEKTLESIKLLEKGFNKCLSQL